MLLMMAVASCAQSTNVGPGPEPVPPRQATRTISVGFYPLSLHNLSAGQHTFEADFYLWLRYERGVEKCYTGIEPCQGEQCKDFVDYRRIERLEAMNARDIRMERTPVTLELSDDKCLTFYRVTGKFQHDFDLYKYPYDQQILSIKLENPELDACEVRYDVIPAKNHIFPQQYKQVSAHLKENLLEVPGWNVDSTNISTKTSEYKTDWGFPKQDCMNLYSQIRVDTTLTRKSRGNLLLVLLPLFVTCVISILSIFVRDYKATLELLVVLFLSVSAQHIGFVSTMPEMQKTRLIDVYFFIVYGFIALSLGLELWLDWRKRNESQRPPMNWFGKLLIGVKMRVLIMTALAVFSFGLMTFLITS